MRCTHPECDADIVALTRCEDHQPQGTNRTLVLTDKGRRAIGAPVMVDVPLLELTWHPDHMKVVE